MSKTPTPTKKELGKEFAELARNLELIGLSSYEAKAYVALIVHGYGSAELISQTAQIPRTSAYKILQSLHSKGFAIATQGRPKIYKPEAPEKIQEKIQEKISTTFERLAPLYGIFTEKGEPQLIYTITGRDRVLEKIGELLDKSTRTFIISTPALTEIKNYLEKKMQNAIKRGVKITIVTEPMQGVPENVNVIRKNRLIVTDVISDNQEALIASPELDTCGYIDNRLLASHMQDFLEILIEYEENER